MKFIQTQNDIELLRVNNDLPLVFINEIEQDFHQLIDEMGIDEEPFSFVLPTHLAIILFEPGDKVLEIINEFLIEYVEWSTVKGVDYYRIAKRNDHDFQLIYTLVGIHDDEIEQWLREKAE
ncbi:hypothetical protein [Cytobacillus praedii]|uniref:hypothetical protein n=1 Tax=Cytobacillus praedii TaxID=1742358 RepID=UPI003AF8D49D